MRAMQSGINDLLTKRFHKIIKKEYVKNATTKKRVNPKLNNVTSIWIMK